MIEDDLRAAMLAHDPEAPRADEVAIASPERSRAPLVVAAIVVLVAALSFGGYALRHHDDVAYSAAGCPTRYDASASKEWVPTAGATDRLVPAAMPTHVVVCAYLQHPSSHPNRTPALSGSRVVAGGLSELVADLRDEPQPAREDACPLFAASSDYDNYLIRLDYPGGHTWVSAPGDHCAGSTNGSFRSSANLLVYVGAAYATGRWPSVRTVGRLGEAEHLVPGKPVALSIDAGVVALHGEGRDIRRTVTGGFDRLVSALNAARSVQSDGSCSHSPRPGAHVYQLTFRYATGPSVEVWINQGCYPEVVNGSLAVEHGTPFFPLIEALLR